MTFRNTEWYAMLVLLLTLSSCKGQTDKPPLLESPSPPGKTSIEFPNLSKTQNSAQSDNVNSILEDQVGNFWFGTTGEGVYLFDGITTKQYSTSNGLKSNMTYCIFESSDGRIWLGTEDGLYVFKERIFDEVFITTAKHSRFKKFSVFSAMEDAEGKLWFATVEGVYVYDGKTFDLFTVSEVGEGYLSKKQNTEYMLQDNEGNIWFGCRMNDGVFRYDGKSVVNFKLQDLNGHQWAWPTIQDKDGNIWFSNWGGAYRFDGKSFKSFTKDDGLGSKSIMRIIEDHQGNIWFGGEEGLCRYDGSSLVHFTTKEGLPHNGVWSIMEDRQHNLWIGTRNTGLCVFDGKKTAVQSTNGKVPAYHWLQR